MERKILKKLLIVLMVMVLISADFFVLGSGIISYAANLESSTNDENIEFTAYFKDVNGERTDTLTESINRQDLKLYAEISVKEEGYFNGTIELQDSNFKLKNTGGSNYISSIDGNKVTLNQINAGETVEIELGIEPIISDKVQLSKESIVKLTGEYVKTQQKLLSTDIGSIEIEAEKTVTANLQPAEDINAELVTDIITNKILSVNGTNKRVVQLLINSRLTENAYPIKQTTINVQVPQLGGQDPEEVQVLSLGTMATNGSTNTNIDGWTNTNGVVQMVITNEANENNEVTWNKNAYDTIIVTFIYNETVDASRVEIKTDSEILVHNSGTKYTATYTKWIENKELNSTITNRNEVITSEIYKGQLYENVNSENKKNIEYKFKNILEVTTTGISDKVVLKESSSVFTTDTTDLPVNTKYIKTEINKAKMLEILGQDGNISIKYGENTINLTKDSQTDENGNIVINYEELPTNLEITTSKPINVGQLEIQHTKIITENTYTREQVRSIRSMKITNIVEGMLSDIKVAENSTETSITMNETYSNAELTVNTENLATMAVNEGVIIGVKLNTADLKYDLYKNPKIRIQLPSEVEEITINSFDKLYGDEFKIERAVYNKVTKTIEIDLTGEQLNYAESQATQLYLQININVKLNETAPSKTEKITMEFTNENAIKYMGDRTDKGVIEKTIGISSPGGLVTINNNETSNIKGIIGVNENKQLESLDVNTARGTDREFKIALINNTKANIQNVNILGKFPSTGEFTINGEKTVNTLDATLKGAINASNCTIYYSTKIDATNNLSDANNGWTQTPTNAKSYLIVINEMPAETTFEATYVMTLPQTLAYDMISYTGYEVTYNGTETVNSLLIGMTTGETIKVETGISGKVGNDILNNGDIVKNGEVIKYTAKIKNTGTQTLSNVNLKGMVPEGTVYVEPEDDYVYTGPSYYEENPNIKEVSKTIETLGVGQEYTFDYEVRVKTDTVEGSNIINKAVASYGEYSFESEEISNTVKKSNLRVSIKRIRDLHSEVMPDGVMEYQVFVENLSDEDITNLKLEVLLENQDIIQIDLIEVTLTTVAEGTNSFTIDKIPAKGLVNYSVVTRIPDDGSTQATAYVKVTDSNNETYRSNFDVQIIDTMTAEVTLTSPTAGQEVNVGDIIEYKITVKNTGTVSTFLSVIDNFPAYVKIEEVYLNGELVMQNTNIDSLENLVPHISNNYQSVIGIEPGETQEIVFITRAIDNGEDFDVKQISNYATVQIAGREKGKSAEVIHTIKNTSSEDTKSIVSGLAWLDANQNGQKDVGEQLLSNITVKLFDVSTNNIATNKDGNIAETKTNDNGEYIFTKMNEGQYIVIFEYDMTQYEPTTYMAEGVSDSLNSKAVVKTININGEEKTCAVTDTIKLSENVYNINIGLKENLIFDFELSKYVTKVSVQNKQGTKSYDYNGEDKTFVQVQIPRKQVDGSLVVAEYTIRVKNNGKLAGTITSIVDYIPSGMTFSSELNPDWYISGNNLYSNSLSNVRIEPGETREIKLILTKSMTGDNVGVVNNRAEIAEIYNEYGKSDIDSTPNNQNANEDDLGSADLMIAVATGARTVIFTILVIINTGLIGVAIYLIFIKNRMKK